MRTLICFVGGLIFALVATMLCLFVGWSSPAEWVPEARFWTAFVVVVAFVAGWVFTETIVPPR